MRLGCIATLLFAAVVEDDAPRPKERVDQYEARTLDDFELRVHRDLAEQEPELLERVLLHLRADLDEIRRIVPPAALAVLQEVTIWVELQGSGDTGSSGRGMCAHWSPAWLREHGLLEEKAGGVEILNPRDFLQWRRDQPYMLLHEMAHAYHWRLPRLDERITAAWRRARDSGRYEAVPRNSLPEGETVRAYAIGNSHEYFAELTEAYFALNDYYPYTRRQLAKHDPEGLALVQAVWALSSEEIAAARGTRR